MNPTEGEDAPLAGLRVVDATRMLPGAVMARSLADLGADVIKLEDPRGGDPLRIMPPFVRRDGSDVGVGFAVHYRGARSIAIRLGTPPGNAAFDRLVATADVVVESFRHGALARFGIDSTLWRTRDPALVFVSLPGYDSPSDARDEIAHDLNVAARSGLLARLAEPPVVPRLQLVDVTCGLLAAQAVLAALVRRGRTGHGARIEQPLGSGALPHVLWSWSEHAVAGRIGTSERVLGGTLPAYGIYRCRDGWLAVGCLEPKFWRTLCDTLELGEHAAAGLDAGPAGQAARGAVASALIDASAARIRERLTSAGVPVDVIVDVAGAGAAAGSWLGERWLENLPVDTGGPYAEIPGPATPLGRTPARPAPRLGAHTAEVLREIGVSEATISACLAQSGHESPGG